MRQRFANGAPGLPVVLLASVLVLLSCGKAPPEAKRPHILLISVTGLRADAIGPRLTPRLHALKEEGAWSGTAIAASSATVPSVASLLTGLPPWRHQVLFGGDTRMDPRLHTLAEALAATGYHTEAWTEGFWMQHRRGAHQGFDSYNRLRRDRRLLRRLAETGDEARLDPQFIWLHLDQPQPPFNRRPAFAVGTTPQMLQRLPERLTAGDLAPYRNPAVPMSESTKAELRAFYNQAVGWTDYRIGRFLDALRDSGQLDRFLIVVTSVHGQALGETAPGQTAQETGIEPVRQPYGHGEDLGRAVIEVPVLLRLPRTEATKLPEPALTVSAQEPFSQLRLWATLVESGGGEAPPAVAPSLYRDAPGGALSELYLINGFNHFSWVDERGLQLLRRVPFAAPEPEYHQARLRVQLRGQPRADEPQLQESPARIFRRLDRAFQRTPPFTGNGDPVESQLLRWSMDRSGVASSVDDAAMLQQLDDALAAAWYSFLDRERSPSHEKAYWSQGR